MYKILVYFNYIRIFLNKEKDLDLYDLDLNDFNLHCFCFIKYSDKALTFSTLCPMIYKWNIDNQTCSTEYQS